VDQNANPLLGAPNTTPDANTAQPSGTQPQSSPNPGGGKAGEPGAKTPVKPEGAATNKPAAATGSDSPVNVTLKAASRAWISVTVDGGKTETLTLDPNDPNLKSRSYHGKERVLVIAGNPAGVEATCNGKNLGVLGPVGQRREVTFTPKGMQ